MPSNPFHWKWALARTAGAMLVTFVVLRWNATTFDETEVRAIAEITLIVGTYESLLSYWKGK